MPSLSQMMGATLALAVLAGGPAAAADRRPLPAGSYQVAQAVDPRVNQLEEEVRTLNGKLEELSYQLLELQEQLRKMQEDNEFRFNQLEGGGTPAAPANRTDAGPAALPAPADTAQAAPAPREAPQGPAVATVQTAPGANAGAERGAPPRDLGTLTINPAGQVVDGSVVFSEQNINTAIDGNAVASLPASEDPETLYREGYQFVLNGDYNQAEGIFRSFVQAYPTDPLAPDARFWLAESVHAQGRLEEAVNMFIEIRKDFPQSQKAPETLLKIGQIMADLGDRDVACVTFADAETSYPQMSDSVRARIREERAKAQC